jgi:hypothetical protein
MFLDFQGCTNAAWDHKDLCEAEYRTIRQRVEKAGLGWCIEAYLSQLRELERQRPSIGGDHRRFDEVRTYREAVARLSLAAVTAIALNGECLEDEILATHRDSDVETLFRIAMQCQIIDDVLDYTEDASAGLPSFLTACGSLPHAMELTAKAARSYAASPGCSSGDGLFPLRMALCVVTAVTTLVVRLADRRHRHARQFAQWRASHLHLTRCSPNAEDPGGPNEDPAAAPSNGTFAMSRRRIPTARKR